MMERTSKAFHQSLNVIKSRFREWQTRIIICHFLYQAKTKGGGCLPKQSGSTIMLCVEGPIILLGTSFPSYCTPQQHSSMKPVTENHKKSINTSTIDFLCLALFSASNSNVHRRFSHSWKGGTLSAFIGPVTRDPGTYHKCNTSDTLQHFALTSTPSRPARSIPHLTAKIASSSG